MDSRCEVLGAALHGVLYLAQRIVKAVFMSF